MPAFKKFGPGDLLDNVLVLEPQYDLVSGSGGWRGSPDASASLFLYAGARSSGIVKDVRYQPISLNTSQFGPQIRSAPQTSSIQMVYMTIDDLSVDPTPQRWGSEHWQTIQNLYSYYGAKDPDFVTSSYDYYCLYFQMDSKNIVHFAPPGDGNPAPPLTASFAVESWVKPFLTSSSTNDFTIASMNGIFWFGISGSTGQLQLSSSIGTFTASLSPSVNRWSHVAMSYDIDSQVLAFAVDSKDAGSIPLAWSVSDFGTTYTPAFTVGNQFDASHAAGEHGPSQQNNISDAYALGGLPNRSFHGFIGETRLWYRARSLSALSSSMSVSLTGSALTGSDLVVCARFTDGPLVMFLTDTSWGGFAPGRMGSGTVDSSAMATIAARSTDISVVNRPTHDAWGWLLSFDDRVGPVWHPNDNVRFTPVKRLVHPPEVTLGLLNNGVQAPQTMNGSALTGSGIDITRRMSVIDIPSAFYGRQIVPGSMVLVDRAFSSGSFGLVRTLIDDGRGNLFLSGSACSSSIAGREDYRGVEWNKVGNVFYGEGLVVIKDPALLDFGRTDGASSHPNDTLQLSFRGTSKVPVKTLMCRLDVGEMNCTINPTYWRTDNDGKRIVRHPSGSIRISTVGIYDSDRTLVGVARFAEPIRKRSTDRINLRLRLDF